MIAMRYGAVPIVRHTGGLKVCLSGCMQLPCAVFCIPVPSPFPFPFVSLLRPSRRCSHCCAFRHAWNNFLQACLEAAKVPNRCLCPISLVYQIKLAVAELSSPSITLRALAFSSGTWCITSFACTDTKTQSCCPTNHDPQDTVFDVDFDKARAAWELYGSSDCQRDGIEATNGFAFEVRDQEPPPECTCCTAASSLMCIAHQCRTSTL